MRIAIPVHTSDPKYPTCKEQQATRTRTRSWLMLGCAVLLSSCTAVGTTPNGAADFDAERALADVATQVALGPRIPGSEAHRQTGDWILGQLQTAGWETQVQEFAFGGVRLRNLIGRAGPGGPGGLLLGAHYDTRPYADRDAVSPQAPVPGANDGASGVAVLLELARVIPQEHLREPVQLVFFDGEDSGRIDGWPWIVGSTEFIAQGQSPPDRAVIVDMVGDADLQLYLEANSDPNLAAEIWAVAEQAGMTAFIAEPGRKILDDHVPFVDAGIPAVDIIDIDYPYWHTTQDTLDKVSAASLAQVGKTLLAWLEQVALEP